MSYILEALRRSQAERERGRVPGLDAQPAATEPAPVSRAFGGVPMVWAASAFGLMLFVIAAVAAWWWSRQQPRPVASALPASAPAAPRMAAEPPAPVARPALPQVVSAPPPPPPLAPPPLATATTAQAAAPAPPRAAARALTLAELPPAQRRELPPLVIGGSVWSDNAAARFVMVNGQVVREGETAAPGVIVERIGPKAVLLRWRDTTIELSL